MTLMEQYCKAHNIPFNPKLSPCMNMTTGDPETHHNCPALCFYNGQICSLCGQQLDWFGDMEYQGLSIDDLFMCQKEFYLMKKIFTHDSRIKNNHNEYKAQLFKAIMVLEGMTTVLNLLGFDFSEDGRITSCEHSKEEMIKKKNQQFLEIEKEFKNDPRCEICSHFGADSKCDRFHIIMKKNASCSYYEAKKKEKKV